MISAQNISKTYDGKRVLNNVSIDVKKGEIISIVGPSGAGKTTLLHILSTLDKPDNKSTKLIINNKKISDLGDDEIAKLRNTEIGFIFQFHELLPEFTSIENVCIPAMIKGDKIEDIRHRAKELLISLDVGHIENQKPAELSGGEQQRVAVARAIINKPKVLFADEPSGNLDTDSSDKLHKLFFELRNLFDLTIVIVTHNKDLANMADRKLKLVDGQWIE